ncbi:Uncharacterised protein [Shewanella morhuae]|uniref:Uncharacterized protein n=1 Tax=Shewanella morhuae TaxID=365591 RepID=A0A380AR48_9GAMM|nr:Uncharacterised protein [Shewanella morhuae]
MDSPVAPPLVTCSRRSERNSWLRCTLRRSQQEAIASSMMTATSDNFFNAYAIFLGASLAQMGFVTGLPQLFGAIAQLLSVWLASHFSRRTFIVFCAVFQGCIVLAMGSVGCFWLRACRVDLYRLSRWLPWFY